LQHQCFYNYQCCTGRCSDDDGDSVYTCTEHTTPQPTNAVSTSTRFALEPVGSQCYGLEKSTCKSTRSCMWRAASCYTKTTTTSTTTTTVKPTKPPLGNGGGGGYGYGYDGGYGGGGGYGYGYGADSTALAVDGKPYSSVRNGVPAGAAIILGLLCLIAFVVGVSHLAKRANSVWLTNEYKKLGVDKIPNKKFMSAEEDGAYWRQTNLIDADTDIQDSTITTTTHISKPMPQLPPRDYTLTGRGTADAGESDYGDSDGEDSWSEDSGSDVPQLPPTEF